jgi:hypothetical protein
MGERKFKSCRFSSTHDSSATRNLYLPRGAWSYISKILSEHAQDLHRGGRHLVDTIDVGEQWRKEASSNLFHMTMNLGDNTMDALLDNIYLGISYTGRDIMEDEEKGRNEMKRCIRSAAADIYGRSEGWMSVEGSEDPEERISYLIYRTD